MNKSSDHNEKGQAYTAKSSEYNRLAELIRNGTRHVHEGTVFSDKETFI